MKKLIVVCLLLCCGCTAQSRAKNFGGTDTKDLPKNQKLVNVTWKENDMWILTRPMHKDDVAETYSFKCNSSFGILEGEIVIKESK
jgi:hypothetical protein